MDIDLEILQSKVNSRMMIKVPDATMTEELPYTPVLKKVMETAYNMARDMHHNCIGTEHLLLGLLNSDNSESIAFQVLSELGVTTEGATNE